MTDYFIRFKVERDMETGDPDDFAFEYDTQIDFVWALYESNTDVVDEDAQFQ